MDSKFKNFFNKVKEAYLNIWKSKAKTCYLLAIIFVIVMIILFSITYFNGGFLNFATDDIIQYYPYMEGFFEKIKNGTLSLYDTTLYGGTSFFAGSYYLPFDPFTLLAFLLSFLMQGEYAYALTNFLRPVFGALILYYLLVRKGFSTKTGFLTGIIYFIGGMVQCYYVFPVYLGIVAYAPLGMLLVDLVIEKRGNYYLLLPLFSVLCILYDFYLAYMLLGFTCIYFLIEMHLKGVYSFWGKKFFLINKDFYKRFFVFMGFIILGVLMSTFILIPSMLYILNESTRTGGHKPESFWYFTIYGTKDFSLRHYFTLFTSLFIPNEPHRLLLRNGSDYIREHASFYLTVGGLIYFVYFFFIWGKEENRLKFWVVLFNLLFCMPIMANIFTAQETPYVRWFFMPYMLNIYAMAYGMNHDNLRLGKSRYWKIAPFAMLVLGLGTLIYVYTKSPSIFIHYTKSDEYFAIILIPSIILLALYLLLLITSFASSFFKNDPKIWHHLTPIMITFECVFAGLLLFSYLEGTSPSYLRNKEDNEFIMENLEANGYDPTEGYRINIYTNSAKAQSNANILYGNVNFGRFFQSFYNTPLNYGQEDIFMDSSSSWSRNFTGGYNLLSSNFFNVRYFVLTPTTISLPEAYYEKIYSESFRNYFKLKTMEPFIVYDEAIDDISTYNLTEREELVLNYAYVRNPKIDSIEGLDPKKKSDKKLITQYEDYKQYLEYQVKFASKDAMDKTLEASNHLRKIFNSKDEVFKEGSRTYYVYDLEKQQAYFKNQDMIEVLASDNKIKEQTYDDCYIIDTEGNKHKMHYYSLYYDGTWTPSKLYVRVPDEKRYSKIYLHTYNFNAYDNYLLKQSTYKDKVFKLDGNKMHLEVNFPDKLHHRIIKTPYTYSKDWKVEDERYVTLNVGGGFLGILVPQDITSVNLDLIYLPKGLKLGSIVSIISSIIYLGLLTPTVIKFIKKKKRKEVDCNEENSDSSSLL